MMVCAKIQEYDTLQKSGYRTDCQSVVVRVWSWVYGLGFWGFGYPTTGSWSQAQTRVDKPESGGPSSMSVGVSDWKSIHHRMLRSIVCVCVCVCSIRTSTRSTGDVVPNREAFPTLRILSRSGNDSKMCWTCNPDPCPEFCHVL